MTPSFCSVDERRHAVECTASSTIHIMLYMSSISASQLSTLSCCYHVARRWSVLLACLGGLSLPSLRSPARVDRGSEYLAKSYGLNCASKGSMMSRRGAVLWPRMTEAWYSPSRLYLSASVPMSSVEPPNSLLDIGVIKPSET